MGHVSTDDIDERYRWDLTDIFASDDAFDAALEEARSLPGRYAAFKGRISRSAADLIAYLRFDEESDVTVGKLVNYASRKADEDTRSARWQAASARVMSLVCDIAASAAFFSPELMGLSDTDVERFIGEEPDLAKYRRALDAELRLRPHVLSGPEETILARAGEMERAPSDIYGLLSDANLSFPDATDAGGESHPVTHATYVPLMMSTDRTLRKSAYESLYGVYAQFEDTFAATLAAQMKQLAFRATSRKYGSTLAYSLDRTEVPTSVYTTLVETVRDEKSMAPMHRYVTARKKILALGELRPYDLYVPLADDVEMTFTYEEATDIMLDALAPLGEDYLEIVKRGLSERWVDVFSTPGKRSGGYSAGGYGMHPVILLNFQGTLDDVYTLVHEMGHSVHTHLSCQSQPAVYSDYVIFVAEVASTVNECLLTRHLLDKFADRPAERRYVLNHYLEQFRSTLYRQTMFAEFELAANEMEARGEGITAESLSDAYRTLVAAYFGPDLALDDSIALEWARIPHFYYEYYVYQYATGFAAAVSLSEQIAAEGAPSVGRYLDFLRGGCSRPPLELLKGAGVDMTGPAAIEQAIAVFSRLVEDFE